MLLCWCVIVAAVVGPAAAAPADVVVVVVVVVVFVVHVEFVALVVLLLLRLLLALLLLLTQHPCVLVTHYVSQVTLHLVLFVAGKGGPWTTAQPVARPQKHGPSKQRPQRAAQGAPSPAPFAILFAAPFALDLLHTLQELLFSLLSTP